MNRSLSPSLRRERGFTIVELLMVVALIGILSSIALPSYQRYVYRAEAAGLVLKMDRLRGVLAELESATGKRVGFDLQVWVESGASSGGAEPKMLWCQSQVPGVRSSCLAQTTQVLSGMNGADLGAPELGIQLRPSAVASTSGSVPGMFSVSVLFPAGNAHGAQVAHAFIDLMRPYADRVILGSSAALLSFRLSTPARS